METRLPSNLEGGATPRMAQSLVVSSLLAGWEKGWAGWTVKGGGAVSSHPPAGPALLVALEEVPTGCWTPPVPPHLVCLVLSREDEEDEGSEEVLLAESVKPSVISVTFWPGSHSLEDVDVRFEQQSGVTMVTLQPCRQRSGLLRMSVLVEAGFLSGVAFFSVSCLFLGLGVGVGDQR